MRLANRLLLVLFVVVLVVALSDEVFAADYDYVLNHSDLPFHDGVNITIIVSEVGNYTVEYGTFLNGESSFSTNISSQVVVHEVFVNVPSSSPLNNSTSFVDVLKDNSSLYNFSFGFDLLNDSFIPDSEFIQVGVNHYELAVCNYSLPYNTSRDVGVVAPPGFLFQAYCPSAYTSCPVSEQTVPSVGSFVHRIFISLGDNLSNGDYRAVVEYNVVGRYSNVTFDFVVRSCLRPPPGLDDLAECAPVLINPTNHTQDEFLECIKLERDYYESIVANIEEQDPEERIVYRVRNVTVYKPVLELSEENSRLFDDLRENNLEINRLLLAVREKDRLVQNLTDELVLSRGEVEVLRESLDEKVGVRTRDLSSQVVRWSGDYAELEKSTIRNTTVWWWVGVVVVGGLLVFLLLRSRGFIL